MVLPDHFLNRLAAHEVAARRGTARRRRRRRPLERPTVRQLRITPRRGDFSQLCCD